jgi:hypothetical protein
MIVGLAETDSGTFVGIQNNSAGVRRLAGVLARRVGVPTDSHKTRRTSSPAKRWVLSMVPIDKKSNDAYRKRVSRGAFGPSGGHDLGVNDSLGFLGGGTDGAGSRCLGVFAAPRLW